MKDYIDRQAAIDAICKAGCGSRYCGRSCNEVKAIERLPSINVAEVRHGRWTFEMLDGIPGYRPTVMFCSKCGRVSVADYNYCPNCGAKMSK